jgi:hypothetical protein
VLVGNADDGTVTLTVTLDRPPSGGHGELLDLIATVVAGAARST